MTGKLSDTGDQNTERTPLLVCKSQSSCDSAEAGRRLSVENETAGLERLPLLKRASVYWLAPPFLLFSIAWGGVFVPKVDLLLDLFCREYYAERDAGFKPWMAEDDQCRIPPVHARTAYFQLTTSIVSGLLSAVSCPRIGAFSDRRGRANGLCIVAVGMIASEVLTAIASSYRDSFPVKLLYLGYVFEGLGGGFNAAMAVSQSYAADCTPIEKRNVSFGYIHGCLYAGVALGPLIAAGAIKLTGSITPFFWIVVGCHAFFLVCLITVIPESLSKERQKKTQEASMGDRTDGGGFFSKSMAYLIAFFTPLKVLWPTGKGSTPQLRRNLVLLALVDTFIVSIALGFVNVMVYYTRFQFGWDSSEQSSFLSVLNICRIICLFLVLPFLTRLFYRFVPERIWKGPARGCDALDVWTIRVAIFCDTIGFLGYTLVTTSGGFFAFGVINCLAGVGFPTLQSAMSKHVASDRTGELLGAVGLLAGLAKIVTPALLNAVYGLTVGKYTQAVFLCLTCACGLLTVATWLIRPGEVSASEEALPSSSADGARLQATHLQAGSADI